MAKWSALLLLLVLQLASVSLRSSLKAAVSTKGMVLSGEEAMLLRLVVEAEETGWQAVQHNTSLLDRIDSNVCHSFCQRCQCLCNHIDVVVAGDRARSKELCHLEVHSLMGDLPLVSQLHCSHLLSKGVIPVFSRQSYKWLYCTVALLLLVSLRPVSLWRRTKTNWTKWQSGEVIALPYQHTHCSVQ